MYYYYSIQAQNFKHLIGQQVLYSIVCCRNKFVPCVVDKINRHLITTPINGFQWVNAEELPNEWKNCPVIYNY